MADNKTGLVITAHPGDFVWRAGGAIALHAKRGYRVKIVCMSYGERGESQFAWKEPGATLEKVKAGRKDEAERAAKLLGAEIEFFDCGDYPLKLNESHFDRMVDIYREINPSFVLTHEGRVDLAIDVDHAIEMALVELQRVVAAVEEFDLCAEEFRCALGLVFAAGFYFFQCGARLFPGKLAFPAFAV